MIGVRDVHQLLHCRWEHGERNHAAPFLHARNQFARAANAADEINAMARARIVDPENRCKQAVLEHGNIEALHRIGVRLRCPCEPIPFFAQIHPHFTGTLRRIPGVFRDRKPSLAHGFQKRLRGAPVQIVHAAVVGENPQLVGREEDAQEPVVGLVARVIRVLRATLLAHTHRAGRAMVAVGNV